MRTTETLTISLPQAIVKQMERVQNEESRTRSELLREAWRQYFESRYPVYTPTRTEFAAIRKGHAEYKRGEYITLTNFTMNWQLLVTKSAKKELTKVPNQDKFVSNTLSMRFGHAMVDPPRRCRPRRRRLQDANGSALSSKNLLAVLPP